MALRVWCVSYYTGLGYSDRSALFLTEFEAKIFAENRIAGGCCKDVKCFETTDIWDFTARHFYEKIVDLIDNRIGNEGSCNIWEYDGVEETFEDELKRTAAEAGIEDFSCDLWNTFESTGLDVYALSCAWTYKGKLYHYTDTLEVF